MNTEQKIEGIYIKDSGRLREVLIELQNQIYTLEERVEKLENEK